MTVIKDGFVHEVEDDGRQRLRLFAPDLSDMAMRNCVLRANR